jgi:hypothetical protein
MANQADSHDVEPACTCINGSGDQDGLPRHRDTEVLQRNEATHSQVTGVVEHRRQVRQQPRQRLHRHRSKVARLPVSTELRTSRHDD